VDKNPPVGIAGIRIFDRKVILHETGVDEDMRKLLQAGLALAAVVAIGGCTKAGAREELSVERLGVITDLNAPECVVADSANGLAYISNIETATKGYWVNDGKGFISQVDRQGRMKKLRWLDSTPAAPINAPKGMCILGGQLYFNDNERLMRCAIETGGPAEVVPLAGARRLNDLATDGEAVWVSDVEAGKVFRVDPKGGRREIMAPKAVNGLACYKGRVFAVSWALHEVYELDPGGTKPPEAFGLASHFTNLDGIEVLDDGTFIVSDFKGNKLCTISPDRKTVRTLITLETPADIGIDRKRDLLYVPQLAKNQAVVFKLRR
jgi:streptogramin lyase